MAWRLNHGITLQQPTQTPGRAGSAGRTTYQDINTRAALLSSDGGEVLNQATLKTEHRRSFVIRYHSEINEKWRLLFDGYAHDIKAIDPIPGSGRNRFIKVVCEVKESAETDVSVTDTGPQPLYGATSAAEIGGGNARQNFDVATYGSEVVNQPMDGVETRVNVSVTDATPSGKYIIFLYPQAWGDPDQFFYRGDTVFNQIGAFRFVPANLLGSTSAFSHRYRAMVSNHRKRTDTPVTGTIVWSG